MIAYCPAVYLISYFLLCHYSLYVHVSNTALFAIDRGRSEFRVESE